MVRTESQVLPAKCKSTASFGAKSKKKKEKSLVPFGGKRLFGRFSADSSDAFRSRSPPTEPKCVCAERMLEFIWSTARLSSLRVSLQNKPYTAQDHLAADASEVKHTVRIVPRETLFARVNGDRKNLHTIKSTQTLRKEVSGLEGPGEYFVVQYLTSIRKLRRLKYAAQKSPFLEPCSGASINFQPQVTKKVCAKVKGECSSSAAWQPCARGS